MFYLSFFKMYFNGPTAIISNYFNNINPARTSINAGFSVGSIRSPLRYVKDILTIRIALKFA